MTSPREKGQHIEGVHHSEMSVLLFRKADEEEEGERWEEASYRASRKGGSVL